MTKVFVTMEPDVTSHRKVFVTIEPDVTSHTKVCVTMEPDVTSHRHEALMGLVTVKCLYPWSPARNSHRQDFVSLWAKNFIHIAKLTC